MIKRLLRFRAPIGGNRADGNSDDVIDEAEFRQLFFAEHFGDDEKKREGGQRKYQNSNYIFHTKQYPLSEE